MLHVAIPDIELAALQGLVEAHRRLGLYRPTAVGIVEDAVSGFSLMVRSPKGRVWGFPQGGIDVGEDVVVALARELGEELGISGEQLTILRFCHTDTRDTPGRKRDGFSRGKLYLYFHVWWAAPGSPVMKYNPTEVDEHHWFALASAPHEISRLCEGVPKKRDSMLAAVGHLLAGT